MFVSALEKFKPNIVIVSAGHDALADNPKIGMSLFPRDFGTLTRIVHYSTEHSLALVIEGGYGPSHGDADTSIFSALKGITAFGNQKGNHIELRRR